MKANEIEARLTVLGWRKPTRSSIVSLQDFVRSFLPSQEYKNEIDADLPHQYTNFWSPFLPVEYEILISPNGLFACAVKEGTKNIECFYWHAQGAALEDVTNAAAQYPLWVAQSMIFPNPDQLEGDELAAFNDLLQVGHFYIWEESDVQAVLHYANVQCVS